MPYDENLKKVDIAVIQTDLKYIREFIENDRKKFDQHLVESNHYRDKIDDLTSAKHSFDSFRDNEFKSHVVTDRWMFGVTFSFLLGIFGVVVTLALK